MTPPAAATRLVLVRHGETDLNRDDRWQGAGSDPPLNAAGRRQATALAERLAGERFGGLYVSPLRRALETAAPIARRLALEPRTIDALREMDHGVWEGRNLPEILARWAAEYEAFESDPVHVRRPGGESYGDLAARLWPALEEIAGRHRSDGALVVTHGGPIRLVLSATLARPLTEREAFGVGNAGSIEIEFGPSGWRLRP